MYTSKKKHDYIDYVSFYRAASAWYKMIVIYSVFYYVFELFLTHVLNVFSLKDDSNGNAYDKESLAIIKLNNTTVLYLKEVTKFLALVCILREESFERKGTDVWHDYSLLNISMFCWLVWK